MQSSHEQSVQSKTSYKDYIEAAKVVELRYGARAPRVPDANQYAPAWDVPDQLAVDATRTLRRIYDLKDLGLRCYTYFESVRPDLTIDWEAAESKNIRLPAPMILNPIQERDVDDLRSFREAVYNSVIVTAMEMARFICGDQYQESYKYSRKSTVNLMRGARWDVLPYAKIGIPPGQGGNTQGSKMVVICIPPWDLSKLDLQDFTTQRTFAEGELDLTPGDMRTSKAHILWAIVYEACKEAQCSYFVVTNYDYWVFGNVNNGYTTASASPVIERSGVRQRPSLLQLLTYWELASIDAIN